MANLSVGTWVRDTSFVVMAMSRYDVILGMEFLYNAEVHVHPHLSCIWIRGMKEPCMVEYEHLNSSKLEPSLQASNIGLIGGNSAMMSLIEERVHVTEGLDEYTMTSRGFMAGESQGLQLNKLLDEDVNQDEGESEAKSLAEGSSCWKTHYSENVGNIQSGTDCSEFLLNKVSCGCFNKEAWGFRHCRSASGVPVITSQWAVWLVVMLLRVATLFPVYGCACGSHEHRELTEELRDSRLEWRGTCMAVNSMGVSAFLDHKAARMWLCYRVFDVYKQGLGQAQRLGRSQEGIIGSEGNILGENHWGCVTGMESLHVGRMIPHGQNI
ncbi:hypothetical protein WN944_010564 [Citrus x changshan-huyou]|uniref:Uncharacterized protein n=1 Tax=Citrus x changshan-huyou TaxID=2935761 RepID=A0AAP0QX87_9ROSI